MKDIRHLVALLITGPTPTRYVPSLIFRIEDYQTTVIALWKVWKVPRVCAKLGFADQTSNRYIVYAFCWLLCGMLGIHTLSLSILIASFVSFFIIWLSPGYVKSLRYLQSTKKPNLNELQFENLVARSKVWWPINSANSPSKKRAAENASVSLFIKGSLWCFQKTLDATYQESLLKLSGTTFRLGRNVCSEILRDIEGLITLRVDELCTSQIFPVDWPYRPWNFTKLYSS